MNLTKSYYVEIEEFNWEYSGLTLCEYTVYDSLEIELDTAKVDSPCHETVLKLAVF